MKKGILFGYGVMLSFALITQSCEDDPILPNCGSGNDADTTWVSDSTYNDPNGGGNGTPVDSTDNGGGSDTTNWNGGNSGGGTPSDTTGTGGNPTDSLGGN